MKNLRLFVFLFWSIIAIMIGLICVVKGEEEVEDSYRLDETPMVEPLIWEA